MTHQYSIPVSIFTDGVEELIDDYRHCVHSAYFQFPGLPSARKDVDCTRDFFFGKIHALKERGIRPVLLLNAELTEWVCKNIHDGSIFDMIQEAARITDISVCSKSPVILKSPRLKNVHKTLSVNATLCSAAALYHFASHVPFNAICLDRSFNRDLRQVEHVVQKVLRGKEIIIMLNEGCLPECPFKFDHRQLTSLLYKSNEAKEIMSENLPKWCNKIFEEDLTISLKSPIVLREHLPLFLERGVNTFKIVGRSLPTSILKTFLKYYEGDFDVDIGFLLCCRKRKGIFTNEISLKHKRFVLHCKMNCFECDRCEKELDSILEKRVGLARLTRSVNKGYTRKTPIYRQIEGQFENQEIITV